jgi:deoxyribonuclease-4
MAILGAHMSIAGGCHRAVERAAECGCDCVQLFTSSNRQWRVRPIGPDEADRFRQSLVQRRISHPLAHASYLINLASPNDALWRKSIDSLVAELRRAEILGIPCVVVHPGSATGISVEAGLAQVVRAIDSIHAQTQDLRVKCLLETTAGQGASLNGRFEHLAAILSGVQDPDRLGVCFDTCHVFAAGYPLCTRQEYRATMKQLDAVAGLAMVKAFHLNDSKRELGSHVDRHAHIGRGHLGLKPFAHLLNDSRFRRVPMYLETPKGRENGEDWDVVNLRTLRSLVK